VTGTSRRPVRLFFSYSHKDERHLNTLKTHLSGLRRRGLIEEWHDRQIAPGQEWDKAIDENLQTSEIVLLLVTPDFMRSEYVNEKEIKRAIEKHERGEARVIPIIVRPVDWEWAPFGKLQALPRDAKPITTWSNRDNAWLDVSRGIHRAIEALTQEFSKSVRSSEQEPKAASIGRRGTAQIPSEPVMTRLVDTQDFGFLFPELQENPDNLLPEGQATRDNLVELGRVMIDDDPTGDDNADIPAAYTYFGKFISHDITLEAASTTLQDPFSPDLAPLPLDHIEDKLQNARTAALELDSIYGLPAPRVGPKMQLGKVTEVGGRPPGKDDNNDLPRGSRNPDPVHDRTGLIGDPRNDLVLILSQLHVAFLRAHNVLVDGGEKFRAARKLLRRHYQHIILHDFLKRIADPQIVDETIRYNRVFDPSPDKVFMPLEFSAAAYRFGHSMVRAEYDFNLNFQPASLEQLFTFTALSGQLGESDLLPENWIIQWPNFVDVGAHFNRARRIDTKLVEPLFRLPDLEGEPHQGDRARLAVRNLLRGYLLRLPTGQAIARTLRQRLSGVRDIPALTPQQIRNGAASQRQVQVLEDAGFLQRTPLWYYILAEAAVLEDGQRLGPVGSTIVAEVLVGLARRSENSILVIQRWEPTLPSTQPGTFTLPDLLRLATVL
jgi:hypothetical protein